MTARRGEDGAEQLTLAVSRKRPRYDGASFILGPPNEVAWRDAQGWLASDSAFFALSGAEGSGKTHLAIALVGADARVDWRDADGAAPVAILDDLPADDPRQFHEALERIEEAGGRAILIGRDEPSRWAGAYSDLRTRLSAMAQSRLGEPDEAMMRAVLVRVFLAHQVRFDERVIEYAARRLPRRFAAASRFADALERRAALMRRKITVALASELLDGDNEVMENPRSASFDTR